MKMTAKEYLSQYKSANREIDRLIEEKSMWMDLATKITPSIKEGGRGSANENGKIPLAVEKIIETEEKITNRIDELIDLREQIESRVSVIPEERQREVLHRRYILCQKWEEIALEMNYSYMQVCRIHGAALQAFKM